jgi:hypothetical protein
MVEPEHRTERPDRMRSVDRSSSAGGRRRRRTFADMLKYRAVPAEGTVYSRTFRSTSQPRRLRPRSLIGGFLLVAAMFAAAYGLSAWQARQEDRQPFAVPPSVDGLLLDRGPAVQQEVDQLRDALAAGLPLTSAVGAAYNGDGESRGSVIFVWGEGSFAAPEASLDAALAISVGDAVELDEARPLPGASVGVMRCGVSPGEGAGVSVCGWAERANFGIGMFPDRGMAESAELLGGLRRKIRGSG